MLFLLRLILALKFKKKQGYRLKMAGNDERYVASVGGIVRAIAASDMGNVPNAQFEIELIKKDDGSYQMKFCDGYLSTLPTSRGIITTLKPKGEYSKFYIKKKGPYLEIFSRVKGENVMRTFRYDISTRGFVMNTTDDKETLLTKFVLLDVGPMYYHCKKDAERFCNKEFEKKDNKDAGITGPAQKNDKPDYDVNSCKKKCDEERDACYKGCEEEEKNRNKPENMNNEEQKAPTEDAKNEFGLPEDALLDLIFDEAPEKGVSPGAKQEDRKPTGPETCPICGTKYKALENLLKDFTEKARDVLQNSQNKGDNM